jgi:DNA-binding transcriptional MerR regulator
MRVGELAAAAGVSVRSLRYYEEHGLLRSERTSGGHRTYDDDAVERVRWIQSLYAAGLSSAALLELLPCVHSGTATVDMIGRLEDQRTRIDEQMRELAATRDRLDSVLASARAHA